VGLSAAVLIVVDHPLPWLLGALAALAAALGAVATRVQLLPEVIDLSLVPTAAGAVGLLFAAYGAARRFGPERLGRVTLFGNLAGGLLALVAIALALMIDVLS
jgi:hypothetical protein